MLVVLDRDTPQTKGGVALPFAGTERGAIVEAQWHLLKHTLHDSVSSPLGPNIQHELKRQLSLDKDRKYRSYGWKILRTVKEVFQATKYQGDTALTIHPSSKMR